MLPLTEVVIFMTSAWVPQSAGYQLGQSDANPSKERELEGGGFQPRCLVPSKGFSHKISFKCSCPRILFWNECIVLL